MAAKPPQPPAEYTPGWLDNLDSRFALTRELRARFDEVCRDLGGAERLSYMQRSLAEQAVYLEYWVACQNRKLAEGGDVDSGRWVQVVQAMSNIFKTLGLERQAKEAPSLGDYLRQKEGE